MAPFQITLGFLLFASGLVSPYSASASGGIRIKLTRADGNTKLSDYELIRRAVERSHRRIRSLTAKQSTDSAASDAPLYSGTGEYFTDLAIGTPRPVPFTAIVDTGSDLTWTQCLPCSACFNQSTPLFDPSSSRSYSAVPCSSNLCQAMDSKRCNRSSNHCQYSVLYADLSHTEGELATETFTVGSAEIPDVAFGCGHDNNVVGVPGSAGLLGLGRGALSLVSQLGTPKFSYCLTPHGSTDKSSLLLGALPDHHAAQTVIFTPLVSNHVFSSFYYLNLSGITVGDTSLDIPQSVFAIDGDGRGGMIIDSGTFLTYLEETAYAAVLEAFLTQTRLRAISSNSYPVDLCFGLPAARTTLEELDLEVPKLVFHFQGGDLELPLENYFALLDARVICLMMSGSRGMSILGNFQQQSMQVSYDLENEMVSFSPARCHL